MDFRILGPLQVDDADRTLPVGGKRARTVLACLVVFAGEILPTSTIVHEVWGEAAPRTAVDTLQSYLSRLRRVLEPGRPRGHRSSLLVTHPSGYLLAVEPERIDARRFEDLVARARTSRTGATVESTATALRGALSLWRGRALDDIESGPLLRAEVERLQELRVTVLEERIEADLRLGLHTELVGELQTLVPAHPLRENLRALLMLALYRAGRQAEALGVFSDARLALVEELGVEPGRRLQRLQADILAQSPHLDGPQATGDPGEPILLRAPGPVGTGGNVRPALDRFVGRESDRSGVEAQLAAARLVTLVGAGGCGKSRLALELAADGGTAFPGGIWLARAAGDETFAATLARALGLPRSVGAGSVDRAADAIAQRVNRAACLMLLDGCEHDLHGATRLVEALLVRCRELRVLATSRQPLGVAGERVRAVGPLPLPPAGATDVETVAASPAAALFADRAEALQPQFALEEGGAAAVARIVRALDGLPLALEAAARDLRLLSLHELADRVEASLVPAAGHGRGLACQHQPACAVGWSYRRLPPPARALLDRLTVFPGSFTVQAAEAVCAIAPAEVPAVLPALRALVDHSLVEASVPGAGPARHRLLASTRGYAGQRLPHHEAAALGQRHAAYYTDLAQHTSLHFASPVERTGALRVLESEQRNLVAALDWTLRRGSMTGALVLARAVQSVRSRPGARPAAGLPPRRPKGLAGGRVVTGGQDGTAESLGA